MINPKIIVGSAIGGFALSFFIGLFSGAGFLAILLRALICAAGLGGISAGIQFVGWKFLAFSLDDVSADAAEQEKNGEELIRPGHNVDITVSDDGEPAVNRDSSVKGKVVYTGELASDEAAVQKKKSDPITSKVSVDPAETVPFPSDTNKLADSEFVPVSLADSVWSQESSAGEKGQPTAAALSDNGVADQLDELPEMGDLEPEGDRQMNEGLIEDSDFASGETEPTKSSGSRPVDVNDTSLITQAIRTVLANDE